jgi:hypothetical protein
MPGASLLILGARLRPRRTEESGEQGITLLVGAFVDVVDRAHHERGGGCRVELPTVRFHFAA